MGGFPGNGLSELFGIISEEIDTLYPSDRNHIRFGNGWEDWEVRDYAEILRLTDAEVLGRYTDDFYQGGAALTRKRYGKGNAYYAAARCCPGQMRPLFEQMLTQAGIPVKQLPEGVEYHVRTGDEGAYEFYLNYGTAPACVQEVYGQDMLTGSEVSGTLTLEGYGAAVVRK